MKNKRSELEQLEQIYRGGRKQNTDPQKFDSTLLQDVIQMNDDIVKNLVFDEQKQSSLANQPTNSRQQAFDTISDFDQFRQKKETDQNQSFEQDPFSSQFEIENGSFLDRNQKESLINFDEAPQGFKLNSFNQNQQDDEDSENFNNKLQNVSEDIISASTLIQKRDHVEIQISDQYHCELTILARKCKVAQYLSFNTNFVLFFYFFTHFIKLTIVIFQGVTFDQAIDLGERNIDQLEQINNYSPGGEAILYNSQFISLVLFLLGYMYNATNLYGIIKENYFKQEHRADFFVGATDNALFRQYFLSFGVFLIFYLFGSVYQIISFNFHREYDQLQITQNQFIEGADSENTFDREKDDQTNEIFFAFLVIFLLLIKITTIIISFFSVKYLIVYKIEYYTLNQNLSCIKN